MPIPVLSRRKVDRNVCDPPVECRASRAQYCSKIPWAPSYTRDALGAGSPDRLPSGIPSVHSQDRPPRLVTPFGISGNPRHMSLAATAAARRLGPSPVVSAPSIQVMATPSPTALTVNRESCRPERTPQRSTASSASSAPVLAPRHRHTPSGPSSSPRATNSGTRAIPQCILTFPLGGISSRKEAGPARLPFSDSSKPRQRYVSGLNHLSVRNGDPMSSDTTRAARTTPRVISLPMGSAALPSRAGQIARVSGPESVQPVTSETITQWLLDSPLPHGGAKTPKSPAASPTLSPPAAEFPSLLACDLDFDDVNGELMGELARMLDVPSLAPATRLGPDLALPVSSDHLAPGGHVRSSAALRLAPVDPLRLAGKRPCSITRPWNLDRSVTRLLSSMIHRDVFDARRALRDDESVEVQDYFDVDNDTESGDEGFNFEGDEPDHLVAAPLSVESPV